MARMDRERRRWQHAIYVTAKACKWEETLQLLAEMRQTGLQPDVKSYNAVVSVCAKNGKQAKALQLLAEMREQGIQPNVITYSAAISACEKSKDQWQAALKLLAASAYAASKHISKLDSGVPTAPSDGIKHAKQGRNKIRFQ